MTNWIVGHERLILWVQIASTGLSLLLLVLPDQQKKLKLLVGSAPLLIAGFLLFANDAISTKHTVDQQETVKKQADALSTIQVSQNNLSREQAKTNELQLQLGKQNDKLYGLQRTSLTQIVGESCPEVWPELKSITYGAKGVDIIGRDLPVFDLVVGAWEVPSDLVHNPRQIARETFRIPMLQAGVVTPVLDFSTPMSSDGLGAVRFEMNSRAGTCDEMWNNIKLNERQYKQTMEIGGGKPARHYLHTQVQCLANYIHHDGDLPCGMTTVNLLDTKPKKR